MGRLSMKLALKRLWDVIETNGCKAPLYEWQSYLGCEFNVLRPYLMPTPEIATSYPCPSPGLEGCPRTIITNKGGFNFAICSCTEFPRNCTKIPIDKDSITIYELRWNDFCQTLAQLLNIEHDFQKMQDYVHTFKIGDYMAHLAESFPVYLTFHYKTEHLKQVLIKLCNSRNSKPFILITSTLRKIDNDTISLMEKAGATFMCLSNILHRDIEGKLRLNVPPDEILKDFRNKIQKDDIEKQIESGKILSKFPALPKDTSWNELTVQFTDGHTVLFTCRGKSMTASYYDLGMAKSRAGKPTVVWDMLYQFAVNHGVIDWKSRSATLHVKKRKNRLCEIFNKIFTIPGNAIIWDKDAKQYRCLFTILPD